MTKAAPCVKPLRPRQTIGAVLLCTLVSSLSAFLSQAAAAEKPVVQHYVLTISGGVSLGAYEGGFVYYLMNYLARRTPSTELAIVTGASAGSLNSFMSILSACSLKKTTAGASLPYRVWDSVGLDNLAIKEDVTPIAAFSRGAFSQAIALLQEAWMEGIKSECDILFGISVTRRSPVQHEVRPGLIITNQNEHFVFRIEGRGPSRPPKISNFMLDDPNEWQLTLPFTGGDLGDFRLLMTALQASGAFPVAFPPMNVYHCFQPGGSHQPCTLKETSVAQFIDGGIFDNTPLKLAYQLARYRFPSANEQRGLLFGVITAGGETHPAMPEASDLQDPTGAKEGLFNYLTALSGHIITTTRSKEISTLLREHPEIHDRLLINLKVLPPAGSYYYAFSGFLDHGFRHFDFALGMWEGDYFVAQGAHEQVNQLQLSTTQRALPSWAVSEGDEESWEIYRCLHQVVATGGSASRSCQLSSAESKRLAIILDTSLDLVAGRCRQNPAPAARFRSCNLLGQRPVQSPPIPGELDRDMFFRVLHERAYPYDNAQHLEGKLWMRTALHPVLQSLAEQQPSAERTFVANGSQLLLDQLSYAPPKAITYGLIGTAITFGRSYSLPGDPDSAIPRGRFEFGSMVQGLDSYLGRADDILALTPYAGFMVDLPRFAHTTYRPRIGLRLGHQFSNRDGWGQHTCDKEQEQKLAYACSRPTIHPYLSMSIWDRLRFDMVYQMFPGQNQSERGELSLMVGLQDLTY